MLVGCLRRLMETKTTAILCFSDAACTTKLQVSAPCRGKPMDLTLAFNYVVIPGQFMFFCFTSIDEPSVVFSSVNISFHHPCQHQHRKSCSVNTKYIQIKKCSFIQIHKYNH